MNEFSESDIAELKAMIKERQFEQMSRASMSDKLSKASKIIADIGKFITGAAIIFALIKGIFIDFVLDIVRSKK